MSRTNYMEVKFEITDYNLFGQNEFNIIGMIRNDTNYNNEISEFDNVHGQKDFMVGFDIEIDKIREFLRKIEWFVNKNSLYFKSYKIINHDEDPN